jgi:hypothetical protein
MSPIIVCPGVHSAELTQSLVAQVSEADTEIGQALWISPVEATWAWAGYPLRGWLDAEFSAQRSQSKTAPQGPPPLTFLAFSAGCVAAAAVAHHWVQQGGRVDCIIAVDGWGVPLVGPFQVHRLSHDFFTHATTTGPRPSQAHFYAAPAVPHLRLWQDPAHVRGWGLPPVGASSGPSHRPVAMTALRFLLQCLAPITYGPPATSGETALSC